MRYFFSFIILCLLSLITGAVFAQDNLGKYHLQGPVQVVRERSFEAKLTPGQADSITKTGRIAFIEYEFNRAGNLIRWADFYQDNMISWFYEIDFDSVNHQKIQWYKQNERFVSSSTVFQYDSTGRELFWYHRDGAETTVFCWKHTYDKRGLKTASYSYKGECRDTLPDTYYIYKNDRKGRRVEEKWYSFNTICIKQIHTRYLKKTNTIETIYANGKGEFLEKWIYSYGEKGELLQSAHYWANDQLESVTSYEYDAWGNLLSVQVYDAVENKMSKKAYQYVYDANNNWTRCIEYVDDAPQKIVEREYVYFE